MKLKRNLLEIYSKEIFNPIHGYPTRIRTLMLYAELYLRKIINIIKYGVVGPDPFEIIYINPQEIQKPTGKRVPSHKGRFKEIGLVAGGSWDKVSRNELRSKYRDKNILNDYKFCFEPDIGNSLFSKSLKLKFEQEKDWEETPIYNYILNHDYYSAERFREIEGLNESIKNSKVKKQKEMDKDILFLDYIDDIMVDISREGEFLFVENRHRLLIAQLLELDRIPVRVVCRHRKWQEKRIQAAKNPQKLSEEDKKHPDIRGLIND